MGRGGRGKCVDFIAMGANVANWGSKASVFLGGIRGERKESQDNDEGTWNEKKGEQKRKRKVQ